MAQQHKPVRAPRARGWGSVCALALLGLGATPLRGQAETSDSTILALPRPGYEPRTIMVGGVAVLPTIDTDVTYDDNILATPDRRAGDTIFSISPRIAAALARNTVDIKADAHADLIRYVSHPRENVNTFGFSLDGRKTIGQTQTLVADLQFDRTYERRSDPEADLDRTRPPALINMTTGEVQYNYQGARFGVGADVMIEQLNYLPLADADRDLMTYRASVRGSLTVGPRISVYISPFVNRRDARLRVDSSGIDRDATTAGVLGGVAFDLTGRLEGNLGLGVFHAQPDDARLRAFTGLAASGRLVWHPRVRTMVTFNMFRGDVATVRAGAIGRIDTRVGLAVDQEARHNLILHASAGIRNVHYRGIERDQRYAIGEGEVRYLFSRYVSMFVGVNYTHRGAQRPEDRFHRWQTQLGGAPDLLI